MDKDFKSWHDEKKKIHADGENKLYKKRDIWWCSLGVNVGYEQDGTGDHTGRPVIVLKGFSKHVCLVVPLTTSAKPNKYHISTRVVGDRQESAIISQIRLIDTKRFVNKVGVLDWKTFNKIRKAVRTLI